eukprot:712399_1
MKCKLLTAESSCLSCATEARNLEFHTMLDTTQPKQNRKRKLPDSFYHTIPKPKRRKLTHRYKEHCKQDVKDRKSYSEEPKISHDPIHTSESNYTIPSLNVFNDSRSQYTSDNDDDGSDTESVSTESSIAQNVHVIQSQPSTPIRNIIIHRNADCLSQSVKRTVQSCHSYEPLQSVVRNIYDEPPIARRVVSLTHKTPMDSNKDRNIYLLFAFIGFLIGFIVCLSVYQENQLNHHANAKEVVDMDEPRVYDVDKS